MSEHPKEKEIPLILAAIGLGLVCLGGSIHSGRAAAPTMMGAVLMSLVETGLLIVAAIVVARLLNIAFGDLKSAALKFCGIALFCAGFDTLVPWGHLLGLIIFLGLVAWLFEIEIVYAIVLAVVYWIVTFIVVLMLASALA